MLWKNHFMYIMNFNVVTFFIQPHQILCVHWYTVPSTYLDTILQYVCMVTLQGTKWILYEVPDENWSMQSTINSRVHVEGYTLVGTLSRNI